MRISDVTVQRFRYPSKTVRDAHGHGHPGDVHDAVQSLLTISTDEGVCGYYFGGVGEDIVKQVVAPMLRGEDPLYRERIWQALRERQRLHLSTLGDRVLTAVDLALWDLAGQMFGQPVHRLLGATRDEVPAYASTMVGDDLPGGLDTPEAYARYALACKEHGYPAFKLHTWQPPLPGAPRHGVEDSTGAELDIGIGQDEEVVLGSSKRQRSLQVLGGPPIDQLGHLG